jgi:hypothetical protein
VISGVEPYGVKTAWAYGYKGCASVRGSEKQAGAGCGGKMAALFYRTPSAFLQGSRGRNVAFSVIYYTKPVQFHSASPYLLMEFYQLISFQFFFNLIIPNLANPCAKNARSLFLKSAIAL